MRIPFRLCLVLLSVLALAVSLLLARSFSIELQVREPQLVSPQKATDLWFNDSGDLMILREDGLKISLETWTSSNNGYRPRGRQSFDFGTVLSGATQLWNSKTSRQRQSDNSYIPYSVSSNGALIAWYWQGVINISSGSKLREGVAPQFQFQSPRKRDIFSLVFSGRDAVTVVYEDGHVRFLGLPEGFGSAGTIVGASAGPLGGRPATIWPIQDGMVAVASFQSGDIGTIRISSDHINSRFTQIPAESGVTLSVGPRDEIAVGTSLGYVILTPPAGSFRGGLIIPVAPNAVSALAFTDGGILIAGALDGLYSVNLRDEDNIIVEELIDMDADVIAVKGDRLAVGGQGVRMLHLARQPVLARPGYIYGSLLLGCLVAIFVLWSREK